MALLDEVKRRLGVFYSEAQKDDDIEQIIKAARQYFKNGGWEFKEDDNLGIEAIVIFAKMAQSTDPTVMKNNPMLTAYITQGRLEKTEEENAEV